MHKRNEYHILKKELSFLTDKNLKVYCPKIKLQKQMGKKYSILEKKVLGNYILCFHPNFSKGSTIKKLRYAKGLSHVLDGYRGSQKNISKFFEHCKSCEDQEGYLMQKFFDISKLKKGMFLNGPFTNFFFEMIEKHKNKVKVLIGQKTAIININRLSGFLYQPV